MDELDDALLVADTYHAPMKPRSASELFRREKSRDKWETAPDHLKRKYEKLAQAELKRFEKKNAKYLRFRAVMKEIYPVELHKDHKHNTTTTAFVRGADMRLRRFDLQEMYQIRVTKVSDLPAQALRLIQSPTGIRLATLVARTQGQDHGPGILKIAP